MKVVIASSLLLLLSASTPAAGAYVDTCLEVRLDDNGNPQDLTGDCDSTDTRFTRKTRLDLNLCYSVDPVSGNIVPKDGGPGLNTSEINHDCSNCFNGNGYELPMSYYACDCPNDPVIGGVYRHSGVNLDDLIENVDGYLTCFNHTATFLSEFINW